MIKKLTTYIKRLLGIQSKTDKRNNTPGVLFVLGPNKERKTLMWFEDKKHRTECIIGLVNSGKYKTIYTQLENEKRWYEIDLKAYKATHAHYFNKQ